jgi:hypothetical protein
MADSSAMADIRGIDIQKLATGFAEVDLEFKNLIRNATTSAREIRWYQKTAGFLDSSDTTAITASHIANTTAKSRPVVVEASWTRKTSYVQFFKVDSPWIAIEDLNDSDPDIWATNIRDLVRAVGYQIELRIINVLTENYTPATIQTAASTQDGWDDAATGDPIADIENAKQGIRSYGYKINSQNRPVLVINSIENKNLIKWLINVKGSSIPSFSSEKVASGSVMEILGCDVVVSENFATDYALLFMRDAAVWKEFIPVTTFTLEDPGIGKKLRIIAEGECLLEHPKAVFLITDTAI